jgi:pimeloyl-ACP methyl ester carboxylesterase
MANDFDVVWLNVSPSLKRLDQPLLKQLSQSRGIAYWQYIQTLDEAGTMQTAVEHLHEFLQGLEQPVHLLGHGISGALGVAYSRRYPQHVRSLTLLSVAPQPLLTWHTHYYAQRDLIPCSQRRILAQMTHSLFGRQLPSSPQALVQALAQDLDACPVAHSLYRIETMSKMAVTLPLLVCGSQTDAIVPPPALHEWIDYFKPGDTLWKCPSGHHFFHFFQPFATSLQIFKFWRQVERREVRLTEAIQVA